MSDKAFTIPTIPFSRKSGQAEVVFKTTHNLTFAKNEHKAKLKVIYSPDKLLMEKPAYEAFLNHEFNRHWQTPEELLDHLVAHLYDELVPLSVRGEMCLESGQIKHRIDAQKRQPNL